MAPKKKKQGSKKPDRVVKPAADYANNEQVIARVKGYPPWPGWIERDDETAGDPELLKVNFYVTDNYCLLSATEVDPWTCAAKEALDAKLAAKGKVTAFMLKLKEAHRQAEENFLKLQGLPTQKASAAVSADADASEGKAKRTGVGSGDRVDEVECSPRSQDEGAVDVVDTDKLEEGASGGGGASRKRPKASEVEIDDQIPSKKRRKETEKSEEKVGSVGASTGNPSKKPKEKESLEVTIPSKVRGSDVQAAAAVKKNPQAGLAAQSTKLKGSGAGKQDKGAQNGPKSVKVGSKTGVQKRPSPQAKAGGDEVEFVAQFKRRTDRGGPAKAVDGAQEKETGGKKLGEKVSSLKVKADKAGGASMTVVAQKMKLSYSTEKEKKRNVQTLDGGGRTPIGAPSTPPGASASGQAGSQATKTAGKGTGSAKGAPRDLHNPKVAEVKGVAPLRKKMETPPRPAIQKHRPGDSQGMTQGSQVRKGTFGKPLEPEHRVRSLQSDSLKKRPSPPAGATLDRQEASPPMQKLSPVVKGRPSPRSPMQEKQGPLSEGATPAPVHDKLSPQVATRGSPAAVDTMLPCDRLTSAVLTAARISAVTPERLPTSLDGYSPITAPEEAQGARLSFDLAWHTSTTAVERAGPAGVGVGSSQEAAPSSPVSSGAEEQFVESFESMLESLTRNRDSIGRTTKYVIDNARLKIAKQVIEVILRKLSGETRASRRIDIFFLIDSIAQLSRLQLDSSDSQLMAAAIQSALPKVLQAVIPPQTAAQEDVKNVLKVLHIWKERRVLPEAAVAHYIMEVSKYSAPQPEASRKVRRQERTVDDPLRGNEDMGVDEYGSMKNLCIPGLSLGQPLLDDDDYDADEPPPGSPARKPLPFSFAAFTSVDNPKISSLDSHPKDSKHFEGTSHASPRAAVVLEAVAQEVEMDEEQGEAVRQFGEYQAPGGRWQEPQPSSTPPLPPSPPPSPPPLPASPPPPPPPPPETFIGGPPGMYNSYMPFVHMSPAQRRAAVGPIAGVPQGFLPQQDPRMSSYAHPGQGFTPQQVVRGRGQEELVSSVSESHWETDSQRGIAAPENSGHVHRYFDHGEQIMGAERLASGPSSDHPYPPGFSQHSTQRDQDVNQFAQPGEAALHQEGGFERPRTKRPEELIAEFGQEPPRDSGQNPLHSMPVLHPSLPPPPPPAPPRSQQFGLGLPAAGPGLSGPIPAPSLVQQIQIQQQQDVGRLEGQRRPPSDQPPGFLARQGPDTQWHDESGGRGFDGGPGRGSVGRGDTDILVQPMVAFAPPSQNGQLQLTEAQRQVADAIQRGADEAEISGIARAWSREPYELVNETVRLLPRLQQQAHGAGLLSTGLGLPPGHGQEPVHQPPFRVHSFQERRRDMVWHRS